MIESLQSPSEAVSLNSIAESSSYSRLPSRPESPQDMSPPLRQLEDVPTAVVQLATELLKATLSSSVIAASAISTSAALPTDAVFADARPHPPPNGECKLLGPFALVVQLALGAMALLVLVYKRWRERPQRPVKVWAFDVSKQVVGSVLLHMANLLMSMLSSGKLGVEAETVVADEEGENPCSFYFLNLLIDVSIPYRVTGVLFIC